MWIVFFHPFRKLSSRWVPSRWRPNGRKTSTSRWQCWRTTRPSSPRGPHCNRTWAVSSGPSHYKYYGVDSGEKKESWRELIHGRITSSSWLSLYLDTSSNNISMPALVFYDLCFFSVGNSIAQNGSLIINEVCHIQRKTKRVSFWVDSLWHL